MIAYISNNRTDTVITFVIEGSELRRAVTTNLMPLFREITLKGLSARKALNAFSDLSESLSPVKSKSKSGYRASTWIIDHTLDEGQHHKLRRRGFIDTHLG